MELATKARTSFPICLQQHLRAYCDEPQQVHGSGSEETDPALQKQLKSKMCVEVPI